MTPKPTNGEPLFRFRLTTKFQGKGKSLDIINDGKNNKPILTKTGNLTGQKWKITKLEAIKVILPPSRTLAQFDDNHWYRLTTKWQGDSKSLDIINDGKNNKPILTKTGNFTGQKWLLKKIPGESYYRMTTKWQGKGKSLDIFE